MDADDSAEAKQTDRHTGLAAAGTGDGTVPGRKPRFVWVPGLLLMATAMVVAVSLAARPSARGVLDRPQGIVSPTSPQPQPEQLCVVQDPEITEASGLAASRKYPGSFWMHNDSGDGPRLFLVRPDGTTRAVVTIPKEHPVDWEDLCSFELDGKSWLMIGDIGDNAEMRAPESQPCRLLLLEEPTLSKEDSGVAPANDEVEELQVETHATLTFRYEDGAVNCESLAVDPANRRILLVSKTNPLRCGLYEIPLTLKGGRSTARARRIGSPGIPFATAMDVSADGRKMVIVTMVNGAIIERGPNETWTDALLRPAGLLEFPAQPQCESVCFDLTGTAVLCHSEFQSQPLWKLRLPGAGADNGPQKE